MHLTICLPGKLTIPIPFQPGYYIFKLLQLVAQKQAFAAMHGPQRVFDIGHCAVIHSDAGGVSLVGQ